MNTNPLVCENKFIDFNLMKQYIGISDKDLFMLYLKEVYKDLADRSEQEKQKGILKMTFKDYTKLSIFISEKVFLAFDNDADGHLNRKEFILGMSSLYSGTFEETIQIIFNILDFNHDGLIQKEDVDIFLSYLPIKQDTEAETATETETETGTMEYQFQMKSLEEIEEIVKGTFDNKPSLNIAEFTSVIENKKSDAYLQILCFLYQQKPFNQENIDILKLKDTKKKLTAPIHNNNANFNVDFRKSTPFKEHESKFLPSPNLRSSLSPACNVFKKALSSPFELNLYNNRAPHSTHHLKKNFVGDNDQIIEDNKNITPHLSGEKGMIRFHNENILNENEANESEYNETNNFNEIIKNSRNVYSSPSNFLLHKKNDKYLKAMPMISSDNNSNNPSINISNQSNPSKRNSNNNLHYTSSTEYTIPSTIKEEPEILYEEYVSKIGQNNKLIKYYLVLLGKDIFYYKNSKKEELAGMHNISGCFVNDNGTRELNTKTYYVFQLIFPSKIRNYYCTTKEIKENFILNIKKSFGYLNFFDYYEMLDDLGNGIFGVVKLGEHKKTKERVAIKIIKKAKTNAKEFEFVKTEIDILKTCHHPNIVKLLDHFENAEYIFIVMEYIPGYNLKEHIKKMESCLFNESLAASIITQIANGLKYLHRLGIIHRDLKPENVMLTECNENGKIKIMDFGLSKILGSHEKTIDGFGTLVYVAPEVLKRVPYNKEIDIWSLGVILYLLMSGSLPFDDENDDEKAIANQIVYSNQMFDHTIWKEKSSLVIDLINKCLIKDPMNRIKIKEILEHQWIAKFNP